MSTGGTGQKLTYATILVAGVASLSATVFSIVYVARPSSLMFSCDSVLITPTTGPYGCKRMCSQLFRPPFDLLADVTTSKNYRKPLLQRYVVRILLMSVCFLTVQNLREWGVWAREEKIH